MTTAEILELVKAGFTPQQIVELQSASPAAHGPVAAAPDAPRSAGKSTPDWIVQHGINKAARRALAAQMRADGRITKAMTPAQRQAAWAKAKKAAKIA